MRVEQFALPVLRRVSTSPRLAPSLDVLLRPHNPFRPDLYVDPYPHYEVLRARGPLFFQRSLNTWICTSYAAAEEILRSSVSVDRGDLFDAVAPWSKLGSAERELFTASLLLVDPPNHTRLRKLVSRAFTPRTVEGIAPRMREIAEGLVDGVVDEDRLDLFAAVFAPLPIYVIGELLGIPEADWPRLKAWSDEFAKVIDPIKAFDPLVLTAAIDEMKVALDQWIELRTAQPGPDLLSKLLEAEDDGGRLSRTEPQSMIALLMTAGHETTSGLLGNAVMALRGRPDLRRRLIDDPDVASPAVEELLRFDSPVQNTDRMAVEDLVVEGQRIKAGQWVLLAIGAANRDPARFVDPDVVDFDRPDNRPLSFGHGIHHCLGAALAREEARVVLPLISEAFADRRVDHSGVRWKESMTLRGPVALPLVRRD